MKRCLVFAILLLPILMFSCNNKPKKLSEEEVIDILNKNNFKDSREIFEKLQATPDTIKFERRFSKSISKNEAIKRIERFYETLIKHIIDNRDSSIISLVQNSYGFDYAPIAKIIKKHNINPDSTLIRLYPALSQEGFMTMVVTLEDLGKNETITAEYPIRLSPSTASNNDVIQEEIFDDICPSPPNCPKTINPIVTDGKISFYKKAINDLIRARDAN